MKFAIAVILILLAIVAIPAGCGMKLIVSDGLTCEQRGGVQLKTYQGFVCAKVEVLK